MFKASYIISSDSDGESDSIIAGTPSPIFGKFQKTSNNRLKLKKSVCSRKILSSSDESDDFIPEPSVKKRKAEKTRTKRNETSSQFRESNKTEMKNAATSQSNQSNKIEKKNGIRIRPYIGSIGLNNARSNSSKYPAATSTERNISPEDSHPVTAHQDDDSMDSVSSVPGEKSSDPVLAPPAHVPTLPIIERKSDEEEANKALIMLSDSETDEISSPDISEESFERILNRLPVNGEASEQGSSPSNSSLSLRYLPLKNKKHHSGHKGKRKDRPSVTEFVRASDVMVEPLPFSPPAHPPKRKACPCKDQSESGASFGLSTRSSRRRGKAASSAACASASSQETPPTPRSKANDSMTQAIDMVSQMEKDEEMARQLQEDMDKEYATLLQASGASTPGRPIAPRARNVSPMAIDVEDDMELRISMLSEWEWQVHVAFVEGTDIPPAPANEFHQTPDEVIDPAVIEYLHTHPEAASDRRAVNSRRRRRLPVTDHMDVDSSDAHFDPMAGLLPTVLGGGTGHRTRQTRSRTRASNVQRPPRPTRPTPDRTGTEEFLESMRILLEFGNPRTGGRGSRRRGRARAWTPGALDETVLDGNDYEELLALEEQLGTAVKKGLTAGQIGRLPTKIFSCDSQTSSSSAENECQVCMSEYKNGDKLRILPCFHNFHEKCIDKWIKDNPTCPVCRNEIHV